MTSNVRSRWPRWAVPLACGVIYALTRWPIYTAGYGGDGDYWNVATAARSFLDTGQYLIGRPPGNPLHEFQMVLSLWIADIFGIHGWWIANFFTSMWALMLLWAVDRLRVRMGTGDAWRWPLLAAVAFLPIFWAHSADGADHAPAAALAIVSLLLALRASRSSFRESVPWSALAGLVLGLAVGYRLGSLTVAPACMWLFFRSRRPRAMLAFGAVFLMSVALCYLPILWTGQLVFPDPRRHGWVGEFMRAVWHSHSAFAPGPVILALVLLWCGRPGIRARLRGLLLSGTPLEQSLAISVVGGIVLLSLVPRDPAYLLPAAACWLVLLTRVLRPRHLAVVAALGVVASWVTFSPVPVDDHRIAWRWQPGEVAMAITEGRRTRDYPLRLLAEKFEPGTVVVFERALHGVGGETFDPVSAADPVAGLWRHPSQPGVWFGGYHVLLREESRQALASGRVSLAIDQGAWDRAKREVDADIYDAVTPWPAAVGTFSF